MELANTGDALKLTDIEDAVVGSRTEPPNRSSRPASVPLTRQAESRSAAPTTGRIRKIQFGLRIINVLPIVITRPFPPHLPDPRWARRRYPPTGPQY
jgi:hypothetical protein